MPDITITEFCEARLAEREALAKAAPGEHWRSFAGEDIAGASVYDEQWLLLTPASYDHDNALSAEPGATGPMYVERARDVLVAHVAASGPAWVLADVVAKREILRLHGQMFIQPGHPMFNDAHLTREPMPLCRSCEPETMFRREKSWPCRTLLTLAAIDSGHPDYQEGWKP